MERKNNEIKVIGEWIEINPSISPNEYGSFFKNQLVSEATGDRVGGSGAYIPPLQPGEREFAKSQLKPFTNPVSDYKSPLVQYDSYDHKWDLRKDEIKKLEKTARKVTDYIKHHPYSTFSDQDGNIINATPSGKLKKDPYNLEVVPVERSRKKINEITTSTTAGEYSGPQELGMRKWTKSELGAFFVDSNHPANNVQKNKTIKNNVLKVVGGWEPRDGKYEVPTNNVSSKKEKRVKTHGEVTTDPISWYKNFDKKNLAKKLAKNSLMEDLAVWFGKKKKPKGSSQPKGPWVDICRKVDGKHAPCGRSDTSTGSYPKCRAAGVAGKMSDSEKRSACQQKRRAEKQDTQTGKGQKPIMTSYKPKNKTNESMKKIINLTESDIKRIVLRVLNEQKVEPVISPNQRISLICKNFTLYQDNGVDRIQFLQNETIEGDLLTDSQVITVSTFQDKGHKTGEPYGTGFEESNVQDVALKFFVKTGEQSFEVFAPETEDYDRTFVLKPISNAFKGLLGIQGESKNIIFNVERGQEKSFCKITKNDPSSEFQGTLTNDWGLNNAPFA